MSDFQEFSKSSWTEEQVRRWWKQHQNDPAPRYGENLTKVLTNEISYDILERGDK